MVAGWQFASRRSRSRPIHYGPANTGQAKHMVKSALDALRPVLPAVTAQIEADLAPIVDLTVPATKTQQWRDAQKALLLVGKLKALAHPFHVRLAAAAGNQWMNNHLLSRGVPASDADPTLLHGDFIAANGGCLPWKLAQSPGNHAMANLGQFKLCFDMPFTEDSESPPDGLPDLWEYAVVHANPPGGPWTHIGLINAANASQAASATGVPLLPNAPTVNLGPVNLGFDEEITDLPEMTFRDEPTSASPPASVSPSDLYSESSVPGWKAATGQHIEVWDEGDEGDGNPYVELQSHLGAHGVKQRFYMQSGSSLNFILRYKGRYNNWGGYENAFDLEVEGASKMLVNGSEAQPSGDASSKSFMEDDEWEKYTDWQYASVSITANESSTGPTPVTLSLVPQTTTAFTSDDNGEEEITYGGLADLLPGDLKIFSGQDAANPVTEDKEETEGAFTVANLNDTDADGKIDNVDSSVKKAADAQDGVEDEADLMKLIVTGPNTGRTKITVVSGAVAFWEMSTKETKKEKAGNAIFIDGTDLPKTLWVEATNHSNTVRDIELRLGWESPYQTLTDNLDTVKATAIWATNTEVRNTTAQTLWDEVDDAAILANWNNGYGGDNFGIHYEDAPVGIGYSIGFQFTVVPTDIGDESAVKFDITRQAEAKIWRLYPFPPPNLNPPPEPVPVEEPQEVSFPNGDMVNDNADQPVADRDNDNTPTNDHIYSIDSPGRPSREADAEEYIFRANFREFVRIKVDGQQPTGNVLSGSRCSPKKDWHLRIHAINDSGTFKQNPNSRMMWLLNILKSEKNHEKANQYSCHRFGHALDIAIAPCRRCGSEQKSGRGDQSHFQS